MARQRDDHDDDYDEHVSDRPPRRRREDDEDYEDEPPRRRRPRSVQLSGFDAMFANTSLIALIFFGLICGDIALILGIVGLAVCKDEPARRNAPIVTVISGVRVAVVVVLVLANLLSKR